MSQQQENQLALVQAEDLALVKNNVLNSKQLAYILKPTAPQYIKQRPAKGGGQWAYISGGYVRKVLNLMFGWNWDFEVVEDKEVHGHIVVLGRLTVRTGGVTITKTQYGDKDIIYENDYVTENGQRVKKKSSRVLDIGNDYKAAATDALKKCAAEFGIGADVYNKEEFRAINVVDTNDDGQGLQQQQHLPQAGVTKQWAHLEQQQAPPPYEEPPLQQVEEVEVVDFIKPHIDQQQQSSQNDLNNNYLTPQDDDFQL